MAKGVGALTVGGLFVAALAFRWFPPSAELGPGPVRLPPALTATVFAVVAAMVAALQVAARQPATAERAEEHLGRISVVESMARIAGIGAVMLVAGDLSRLRVDSPYTVLILLEFAAGVFVAGIATDASLVTERRYGAALRETRRRRREAAVRAAIVTVEGGARPLPSTSARRRGYVADLVAIAAMVTLIGLAAAGLGHGKPWAIVVAVFLLTAVAIPLWGSVRAGFLVGARFDAILPAAMISLLVAALTSGVMEAAVERSRSTEELVRDFAMIVVVFLGPVVPALWAHRAARSPRLSFGDGLVLPCLRRRLPQHDRSAPAHVRAWRGWTALFFAVLAPPVGVASAQLIRRGEGVKATDKDRRLCRWSWAAGLAGTAMWVAGSFVLWNVYLAG